MKYSLAYRNAANDASVALLEPFAVSFYGPTTDITTTIPTLATDLAVANSNILLCTFTVGNDGVTGMTWDASALGSVARAAAESVSGTCVAAGYPRFFRVHLLADTNGNAADTTKKRWQGTLGTTSTYDGILDTTFYPMVLSTVYPLGNIVDTFDAGN